MKSIVFFGNCQAEALAHFYQAYIGPLFDQRAIYVDAHHFEVDPSLQARKLKEADVLVVQQFDFPSKVTADDLKQGVQKFAFPLIVGGFYWPYGRTGHPLNKSEVFLPPGPYGPEMGDSYLNKKVRSRAPLEESITEYMNLDIAKAANLDRVYEMYVDRQRARDAQTSVSIAEFIDSNYRDEYLFVTPAHPNLALFKHLASQLYVQMGVSETTVDETLSRLRETPFPKDSLPIHPGVRRHLGLTFIGEDSTYSHLYEGTFTFEKYCRRYLAYDWNRELQEGIYLAGTVDLDAALAKLDFGLQTSARSHVGWRYKSHVLTRLHRIDESIAAAERSVEIAPRDIEALLNLATVRSAGGDLAGAEGAALRAFDVNPDSGAVHKTFARIEARSGRTAKAVKFAREATRLVPGDPDGHAVLASMLLADGRPADAEFALAAVKALAPDMELPIHQVSEALASQSRHEEAISALQSELEKRPHDFDLRLALAYQFVKINRFSVAEEQLRRLIASKPDMIDIRHMLGDILVRQGRPQEAVPVLQATLALASDNARLHCTLGHAFVAVDEMRRAADAFRQAVELDPAEPDYKRCLDMVTEFII